jgi:hypothetical protein
MTRKPKPIQVNSGDVFVDRGFADAGERTHKRDKRLSWEDTFKDMAREREDWSDFEGIVADGLEAAERW